MLILLDNYDSFTWNLFQALSRHRARVPRVRVVRNDHTDIATLLRSRPRGIVISPGPGRPERAGICLALLERLLRDHEQGRPVPAVLGVCLGMQCLGQACGGRIVRAKTVMHGKVSTIVQRGRCALFKSVPQRFEATRYHSLCLSSCPAPLRLSACVEGEGKGEETIMAITHKRAPFFGLQFHPESVACPLGEQILDNFVDLCALDLKAA